MSRQCEVWSASRQCELAVWSVRNGPYMDWQPLPSPLPLHGQRFGQRCASCARLTQSTFEAARVQQRWKRAAGLLRGTMHDADCDCDWVAIERLEKVDLRLRQGCSGVELQRQGIAGLQRRGTAACAQAAERPSS